ncbi:MAG: methyltransferase domain-containing protein [Nocardioidaceae bacterium]
MTPRLVQACSGGVVAGAAEVFSAALRGQTCLVHGLGDQAVVLPTQRWAADACVGDEALLSRCAGPTIDVGCGPGRLTHALSLRGVTSLGVDIIPEAVAQARARGANALLRDLFARLPGEGRWSSALLADGNIGIGGDPVRLLRRVSHLVAADGVIVVDLASPGLGIRTRSVRLEVAGRRSAPFAWSLVSPEALTGLARAAALTVLDVAASHDRWVAELTPVRGGGR